MPVSIRNLYRQTLLIYTIKIGLEELIFTGDVVNLLLGKINLFLGRVDVVSDRCSRFLVVDYFFFTRKYHIGSCEFLAEKTVEFPQEQRKVLPFLLVNCGEEQVHSQTLPEFITSNYEYEGNLAVRDIELVREESDISDTEGMNQEEL